jgi:hypothetical protein
VGNDYLYFALIETPWLDDSNFAKALVAGRAFWGIGGGYRSISPHKTPMNSVI